jgi:Protein of unknown function (DUF2802)
MLETFPWPQTILGLAAALAILVIYDVAYVWPIHRRIKRLADRCDGLERSLGSVVDALATRVATLERHGREDLGRLSERVGQLELATESRSYEQAITSAEHGEEVARLITCFGLTEGEAELVRLLHGDRSRRTPFPKTT